MVDPRSVPVRYSHLRRIARSPAHYLAALESDQRSPQMQLGRVVHALILGQPEVAVWNGTRRGKAWDDFRAASADALISSPSDYVAASSMAAAIEKCSDAKRLLDGRRELEIKWRIGERECLSHLDVLGHGFITDLKTARSSEPEGFSRAARLAGYHAQLAWYADAAAFIGAPVSEAYVVAVESSPPYPVTMFRFTERALDAGRRLCRLWLERLLGCEAANEWPGYAQSIIDVDIEQDPELIFEDTE